MTRSIDGIRNIGIIAHIDAGKTTTTERILYYTGASYRMGNVDDGTTQTDFDPEEAQRGITIYSAAVTCEWDDHTINIIDTPGHVDFTAEVERSLRVLDGAVVIFSAVEGVEAQSETVWRQADHYQVPRFCFINKMDRIGADFDQVLRAMRSRLKATPLPVQIPIGQGPVTNADGFRGIIDLLTMKAMYWDIESRGAEFRTEDIPAELADDAELMRSDLLDALSEVDEELMEAHLEDQGVSRDLMVRALRAGTITGQFQPVLCGSSLDYIGVQPVLDAVAEFLPSPLDRPAVVGIDTSPKANGKEVSREATTKEPVSVLVFKIQSDNHGDLYFARVYSGVLKSNSRLLNPRTKKKELITQLWHIQSDSREKVESVEAGDICGIVGPKDTGTGDTLCDPQKPIALEQIRFPETVISMAIEPESSADRKKLVEVLEKLQRQDPTFTAKTDEETGQTIVSGMGELHLEVVRHRMERDFRMKVRVHKPRVSYREKLGDSAKVSAEFDVTTPAGTLFFGLDLTAEEFTGGDSPITVSYKLKPGTLPEPMKKVLLESLEREANGGGKDGYPLMSLRLTVNKIDYREGETTDTAVMSAVSQAFNKLLQQGNFLLMEPVMTLEVVTPEEFLGNIQSDLNSRRAMIVDSDRRGDLCVLHAEVPLIEMFGYSTQIRSLSQGRASYSMEPCRYSEAPRDSTQ
ncbi:MAG: elongation factor G [Fuerstiella sp.]|nr:elongation factor G [Fuerstiella sp.]MCP4858739.1 elongation factor G [Fuerstiella sp.]